MSEFRDGDVYRWRYKLECGENTYTRHWCCSCVGIINDGVLVDTFWGSSGENKRFPLPCAGIDMAFLGNLGDYEKRPEYMREYLSQSDYMDMNHSNSTRGNFYVRKGAARSASAMLDAIDYRMKLAISDLQSAEEQIKRMKELRSKVTTGDLSVHI